ncbi:MAG: bacterial transcriptional activator domain-containing protein [Planctomycetes bacterium]|nr:bacterial transcriptional activator domain-containing protein [Planctomycetota bacterium]
MLRRSLQVFVALSLVALAVVLGYAALRLRGPEEMLREAQACYDRGEYARTVVVLDHGARSHSLSRDPSKLARLYRLRHAAQLQLDNAPAALQDLERLLSVSGSPDTELALEHVRLLAVVGRGQDALVEAKALLAREPENGRAMELAGEALQSVYRDELAAVFAAVDRDHGLGRSGPARAALLAYLYRPDPDVEVGRGLSALAEIYAARPAVAANWPVLQRRLVALRELVQTSLRWFRDALERPGQPVAAMRGLAWSLRQAARHDDLFALCEIYRRRFDHRYVFEAGAAAAWAMVDQGQPEAALAASLRWLPAGSVAKTTPANQFPPEVGDLLLARFAAARSLENATALDTLASDVRALEAIGVATGPVNALVHGTLNGLRKQPAQAEKTLRWGLYQLLRGPTPLGQVDLAPSIAELRVQALADSGSGEADQLAVFGEWQRGRPGDPQPLRALAAFQLRQRRGGAALAALDEAAVHGSEDEAAFGLRLRAAELVLRDAGQDGASLLAQCLQRKTATPEVTDPLGFVLCTEAALASGVAPVALAAARRAAERFPERALPRRLEAAAWLAAGQPAEAAQRLRSLCTADPSDEASAELLLRAVRAGAPVGRDDLPRLMTTLAPRPELTAELLRAAIADAAPHALGLVPAELPPTNLELQVLAAHAAALANDTASAHRLLTKAAPALATAPPAQRAAFAAALAAAMVAGSAEPDANLARRTHQGLLAAEPLPETAAAPLRAAAERLAAARPATAYRFAAAALACAAPEARDGALHALAGDLALQLGELQQARQHGAAAVAFADGRGAAENLALLELALGRPERAAQVYRLTTAATRPGLALRLQDRTQALALAEQAVATDRADLLAHVVLQLCGATSLCPDLVVGDDAQRQTLAELVALLEHRGAGKAAEPLALQLVAAHPGAASAQLLLARAHLEAGRPAAALAVYSALQTAGQGAPLLWRELAVAATHPRFPVTLGDTLTMALARAVATGGVADSPLARATSMQLAARHVARLGNLPLADQLDANRWLEFPSVLPPSIFELTALAARGRPRDAFWILVRRLPEVAGGDTDLAARLLGRLATDLLGKGGDDAKGVREAVQPWLVAAEPFGDLLHLLPNELASAPDAQVRQRLTRHLELVASGRDDEQQLPRTMSVLVARFGPNAAIAALDQAIAAHPTQMALWQARAELLVERGEAATAIPALRAALQHAETPLRVLDLCVLVASSGGATPADRQAFGRLPEWLVATRRGQLAKGLLELRAGRAEAAVAALQGAEPRADGLHLQALALAQLQTKDPDASQRAAASFQKLAADYPSSSRARYAGSFARQLSGR